MKNFESPNSSSFSFHYDQEAIAKKISALRNERGYSKARVIAKLQLNNIKVSPTNYTRYENGKLPIPSNVLLTLCQIYRISPNKMVGFYDNLYLYQKQKFIYEHLFKASNSIAFSLKEFKMFLENEHF